MRAEPAAVNALLREIIGPNFDEGEEGEAIVEEPANWNNVTMEREQAIIDGELS
jgi:hypothetical protein